MTGESPDGKWARWWGAWITAGVIAEVLALRRRKQGATFSAQVRYILRSLEEAGPVGRGVRWAASGAIGAFFTWVIIHFTKPF